MLDDIFVYKQSCGFENLVRDSSPLGNFDILFCLDNKRHLHQKMFYETAFHIRNPNITTGFCELNYSE